MKVTDIAGIGQCKSTTKQQNDAPRHTLVDGRPVQKWRWRAHGPAAVYSDRQTHTHPFSASRHRSMDTIKRCSQLTTTSLKMICNDFLVVKDLIILKTFDQQFTLTTVLSINRAKTHRHTDKRRNRFLKHKRVKHFLSKLNNNKNETSASWYDVTHDDDFQRIAILNRPLKLFFLALCGVIYYTDGFMSQ